MLEVTLGHSQEELIACDYYIPVRGRDFQPSGIHRGLSTCRIIPSVDTGAHLSTRKKN